jgi:hypothetical protein
MREGVVSLLYVLVVGEAAFAVAVVFVMAWRDGDVPRTVALGAVLFSLLLVVLVALRDQA